MIEDCQNQLEALCRRLWPQPLTLPTHPALPGDGFDGDDGELIRLASSARNGDKFKRLFSGDTSMHGGDDSAADLALCNMLAFWTGRDPERMDRLFRGSGLYREKWEREDYRAATIARAIENCRETYKTPGPRVNGHVGGPTDRTAPAKTSSNAGEPPKIIIIDTDEHRVVAETIQALTADPGIYQRGTMLVRVLREARRDDGVVRPEGSATISILPGANLRERMTRVALFAKRLRRGDDVVEVPAHPTSWLVNAVEARGEWDGIPTLSGVSDAPILRADGSVWQTPGYDAVTGVFYEPAPDLVFPLIDPGVGLDDAQAAVDSLLETVCDFRFDTEDHRAAWLASLLTPLARFAYSGPSPFFLFDANVRGAGKGLLAQIIGGVVLGREMSVSSYAHDPEEMRKKITAIALAGDQMVLLDNLEGGFGNDALDRALTSTRWKDRVLGKSELVDLPLVPVWYGTGNNVAVAADTVRRIVHIRLDVMAEKPEERTGFRHPDLTVWVRANRGRLLSAALTILAAYCRCGRPDQSLTPFGSFEGWSALVRQAVVWAGLPDPCRTRQRLAETSDTTTDVLSRVIDACRLYDPSNNGIVVAELLQRLYPGQHEAGSTDEASSAMRAALEGLINVPAGKAPSSRQVGKRLSKFRRRVLGGFYLDTDPNEYHRSGAVWRVHTVEKEPGSASLRV